MGGKYYFIHITFSILKTVLLLKYSLYSLHSSINKISSQKRYTKIGNFKEYHNKIPKIDCDWHHNQYKRRTGRMGQAETTRSTSKIRNLLFSSGIHRINVFNQRLRQ